MYLSFKEYQKLGNPVMSEQEYQNAAPIADAVIDDWTLGRVGRAYEADEEIPDAVLRVYRAIIESVPAMIESSKVEKGEPVSSFSNGVDTFTFGASEPMGQRLRRSVGWMLDLLPVEWVSGVASYRGGNDAR